jgi:hypothetical protein
MGNIYQPPPPNAAHRKFLVLGLLGLAAFLAVEALLLRSHIRVETRPPAWDQAIHLEIALDYREALAEGRVSDAWHLAPKSGMPAFPPAYHLLLMRAYDSADPARAALWANWFYLALLAVSIYGIGWHFRKDETPLIGALLFCAAPVVQDMLTTQLVDLPMTALAAFAYWALLLADDFTAWPGAILFGIAHAAGMLHKWSFFSYMLPAYWLAGKCLFRRPSALPTFAAAILSAALILPWYSAHIALMPSRLVQASADFAVSPAKLEAWLSYFRQGVDGLGPVFWLAGLAALVSPQYARRPEHGWIVGAWFLTSYIFWTLVPNRQLRFLLPGLVPLGVAFCATWPKGFSWGVTALQLVAMLNFHAGWLPPIPVPLPFVQPRFFVSAPAAREDWKLEEILRKVEAERDPTRPITNLTLVANHERFNPPTFHWVQRRLKMEFVRMRGVNRRLSELSEFVLLKDGKLGAPTVIGGLPEAAAQIKDPGGWFPRAYEEIARWTLPDGTPAILYRQRRGARKPYEGKRIDYQVYTAGKVEAKNLKAEFGQWDASRSAYKAASVSADKLSIRGLEIVGVSADLHGFGFVPVIQDGKAEDWADIRLMRLERLVLKSLDIGAEELKAFLVERVKGLEVSEVSLDRTVRVSGAYKGRPASFEVRPELLDQPRRLRLTVLEARLGGLSIPPWVFKEIKELTIPLYPNPETPFAIELPGFTLSGGRLTIP